MNLLGVRTAFVEDSGRYDLVLNTTNYTDNGADRWIRAGQRYLDSRVEFSKRKAEYEISVAAGSYFFAVSDAYSIQDVSLRDPSDDTITHLIPQSLRDLRARYGNDVDNLSDIDQGQPQFWSLGVLRNASVAASSVTYQNRKLIVSPPADGTYTLLVTTFKKSNKLSANTDESYWSVEHPDLLIASSMMMLEGIKLRNLTGANNLKVFIEDSLNDIEDLVTEQEVVGQDQMDPGDRFMRDSPDRVVRHNL